MITIWDSFIFFFHLYFAMENNLFFNFFITPSFWFFILSFFFEMKLLVMLWRLKYEHEMVTEELVRKGIFKLHCKLYLVMIIFLLSVYYMRCSPVSLMIWSFYFVPQIVSLAIKG